MAKKPHKKTAGKRPTSYDRLIKAVMKRFYPDLAEFLVGERPTEVREVESGLAATAERFADKILSLRFEGRPGVLLHVEFQTEGDKDIPQRMAEYQSLLARALSSKEHGDKRFACVVVYLDRDTYRPDPGFIELSGELGTSLSATYKVIRLWEVDPEPILAMETPGLYPFVPLMAGNAMELVIRSQKKIGAVAERIASVEQKRDLLGALAALAGRVVKDRDTLRKLISEIRAMDDKNYVFELLREEGEVVGYARGKQEGLEKGLEEGKRSEAHRAVEEVLRRRFTAVPKDLHDALAAIEDIDRLELLHGEAVVCQDLETFRDLVAGG